MNKAFRKEIKVYKMLLFNKTHVFESEANTLNTSSKTMDINVYGCVWFVLFTC